MTCMEGAVLAKIGKPAPELNVADSPLGFRNRPAADAVQHEFVPSLISGSQFFAGPPTLLTSLIASRSNVPSDGARTSAFS